MCKASAELDFVGNCGGGGLGSEPIDFPAEARIQFLGLPDRHSRGRDRLTHIHGDLARIEVPGVHGQQVVNSAQGNGDDRHLGANGEKGRSGQKRLHVSVGCARAFWKDKQRHARPQSADAGPEARNRRIGTDCVYRDLAGTVEVPADERHGPQLLFGQDPKLKRKGRENDRRIHIGRMVGGIDGNRVPAKILLAANRQRGPRDANTPTGPDLRQAVLQASTLVPEGSKQGQTSADSGVQKEEWSLQDIGAPTVQPGQWIRWAAAVHGSWPTRSGGGMGAADCADLPSRRLRTSPTR